MPPSALTFITQPSTPPAPTAHVTTGASAPPEPQAPPEPKPTPVPQEHPTDPSYDQPPDDAPAPPDARSGGSTSEAGPGPPDQAAPGPTAPRHCWLLDMPGTGLRSPGVLTEWEQHTDRTWHARVTYAVPDHDRTVVVTAWIPANLLAPA